MDKAKEKEFWQDKLQVVSEPNAILLLGRVQVLTEGIVLAILCGKTYFVFRRPTRGDEAEEAVYKMPEIGGVDDGLRNTNCVRL